MMFINKLKALAQTVGFVAMIMFVLYGALSIFTNARIAFGAPPKAPSQQAAPSKTVPPYLSYQGTLRNPEGQPISGVHKLTFRIYDDVTDPLPEALWMEEHNEVTVRNGQFSVLLGNNQPIPPALFSGPDMYIGVTLDTLDEMVPRQRFASAPFAMYADHAASLTAPNGSSAPVVHVDETGRVGIGTISPQAQVQISSTAPFTTALQVDGGVRISNGNVLLALETGRVGIGQSNPLYPLHVGGQDPDMMLDLPSTSAANRAELLFGVDGQTRSSLAYDKTTGDTSLLNGNSSLVLDDGGVNAIAPHLRVYGDLHAYGNFYLGAGVKPVRILRFSNQPENVGKIWTAVSAADYECTVGAWSTGVYDMSEDSKDADKVWPFIEDGWWWVAVKFMSDGPHEKPSVDVICFHKGIVEYDTTYGNREDIGE